MCFSHCLAVADAASAATGLLGQWRGLLPVPAGLLWWLKGQRGPVSAAMCPTEDVGRDAAVGMRLGGFVRVDQRHLCSLAIASDLGSIL